MIYVLKEKYWLINSVIFIYFLMGFSVPENRSDFGVLDIYIYFFFQASFASLNFSVWTLCSVFIWSWSVTRVIRLDLFFFWLILKGTPPSSGCLCWSLIILRYYHLFFKFLNYRCQTQGSDKLKQGHIWLAIFCWQITWFTLTCMTWCFLLKYCTKIANCLLICFCYQSPFENQ